MRNQQQARVEPVEPVTLRLAAAELQLATMPACRLRAKIAAAGVTIGGRSGDVEPMKATGLSSDDEDSPVSHCLLCDIRRPRSPR